MFCRNCGHEIPDDSKFCESCGAVLQNDARQVSPKYDGGNYTKNEALDKSSGTKGGLPLIVTIVFLAVIAYGIFSFFGMGNLSVIIGLIIGISATMLIKKILKK